MLQSRTLTAKPTLELKQTEFGRLLLFVFFVVSVFLGVLLSLNAFSLSWSLLGMPTLELKQTEFGKLALSYFFGVANLLIVNALLLSWFILGLIIFCALTLIALYFPMSKEQKEIDRKIDNIKALKASSLLSFEKILAKNIFSDFERFIAFAFFTSQALFDLYLLNVVSAIKLKRGIIDINLSSKLLPTPLLACA